MILKNKIKCLKCITCDRFTIRTLLSENISPYYYNNMHPKMVPLIIEILLIFYPELNRSELNENIIYDGKLIFGKFAYILDDEYSKYDIISEIRKEKFKKLLE